MKAAEVSGNSFDAVLDAPVGERLREHPFYYNVYALRGAAKSMDPVAGAIIWTGSSEAGPGELDLHISGTHIFAMGGADDRSAVVDASGAVRGVDGLHVVDAS